VIETTIAFGERAYRFSRLEGAARLKDLAAFVLSPTLLIESSANEIRVREAELPIGDSPRKPRPALPLPLRPFSGAITEGDSESRAASGQLFITKGWRVAAPTCARRYMPHNMALFIILVSRRELLMPCFYLPAAINELSAFCDIYLHINKCGR